MLQLLAGEVGAPVPRAPRPLSVDFRFVSEQQLQADLAAATDPSYRPRDPFVAAFVSLCVGECRQQLRRSEDQNSWGALAGCPGSVLGTAAPSIAVGAARCPLRKAAQTAILEPCTPPRTHRLPTRSELCIHLPVL